jgi:hypothetical protein
MPSLALTFSFTREKGRGIFAGDKFAVDAQVLRTLETRLSCPARSRYRVTCWVGKPLPIAANVAGWMQQAALPNKPCLLPYLLFPTISDIYIARVFEFTGGKGVKNVDHRFLKLTHSQKDLQLPNKAVPLSRSFALSLIYYFNSKRETI